MPERAAIYARISSDPRGLALGVERQRADCEALAQRLGWPIVAVYIDNDTSASTTKPRPEYQRLLADVEAGSVDAILVYDVDRLTRRPVELEAIIALAELRGVSLASVGGEIDLGSPQGRLTARIKGSVARHEVEQQSRRIKRKFDEKAQQGTPHGPCPYGWRREPVVDADGRLTGTRDVVDEPAAAIVQECARRVLAGESLRAIAADLNSRGVPLPHPRSEGEFEPKPRWVQITVRQLLLRDSNGGHRTHRGQRIGPALRPAIVDPDLHERVVATLRDPARRTSRPGAPRHLLSGLALCGKCGAGMRVNVGASGRPPALICPECFGVRRRADGVEDFVVKIVTARLALPDAVEALRGDDTATRNALDAAAALRARLDLASDLYMRGEIDDRQLARITAGIRPDLDRWEAVAQRGSAHPDLHDLTGADVVARWPSIPIERQRAAIDALMIITILPVGKGARPGFDPAGVRIDWRRSPAVIS